MRKLYYHVSFVVTTMLLLGSAGTAHGQTAAAYGFTALSGTYTPVTGGTSVAILGDDVTVTAQPIGFNFVYCGTTFTQFAVCSNGFFNLSNTTFSTYTNQQSTIPGAFLMPYWDDGYGSTTGAAASRVVTGTAPNRVLTMEWKNWGFCCSTTPYHNFQVKLYETTNVIEFVYSPITAYSSSATIGIANGTADYKVLNNATASPTASSTTFTTSINTQSVNGQIYRWTPPASLPAPALAATPNPVCLGTTLNMTASSAAINPVFNWAGPNSFSATGPSVTIPAITAAQAGTYTCTVTSGTSTSTAATVNITVSTASASITAGGPTTFCTGGVLLSANTGTNFTYQWQSNGSSIPGATASTYNATTSGYYTAIVTNASSCFITSNNIQVNAGVAPATITPAGSSVGFCQGGSINLTGPTQSGYTYQWKLNGNAINNATNVSYTANQTGVYTIQVTGTPSTCTSISSPVSVTVFPLPATNITPAGNVNLCSGSNMQLVVPAVSGNTYVWKKDGVTVSGATTNTLTVTAGGSYKAFITNSNGCLDSTTAPTVVTVVALPQTPVVNPSVPTSACDSLLLSGSSATTGVTYQWNYNNAIIPGSTSNVHSAVSSGNYTVTAINNFGCIATSPATAVTINQSPSGSINYATPLSFCQGSAVVLNAFTSNGLSYQWYNNNQVISGETSPSYVADSSGLYSVKITNAFGCSKTTPAVLVQAHALPVPVVTRVNNTLSTGVYANYQWFHNGQPIPGANLQSYSFNQNGGYHVVVTDNNGCQGLSSIHFIDNTGVGNLNTEGLHLYPNPVNDRLFIESPFEVDVYITDMAGRNIIIATDAQQVDLSTLAKGLYMAVIRDADGNLLKKERLIKL